MSQSIEKRLTELGIDLPEAAAPAANYLPYSKFGKLLITSGQLPMVDGKMAMTGRLGANLKTDDGQEAARLCAINILSQVKSAAGDLEKIKKLIKITVFVASTPDFTEQHLVANGASNLFVAVLGDSGRHARSAVGTVALPLNAPVEIEAMLELR